MARVQEAIARLHGGDRPGAVSRFETLWTEIGPHGDPLHRCTLAHFMADAQEDPHDELAWDLRALEAADSLSNERLKTYHASLELAAFYPSLHLNLAEDYRKLGKLAEACEHLERAEARLGELPDDGYGNFVRMGVTRMAEQLRER